MSVIKSTHIWIDDRGMAWIDQTNLKVIEIALELLAHGSSVEEIVEQHKGLITLAQSVLFSIVQRVFDNRHSHSHQPR